jgi:hypothetical protein
MSARKQALEAMGRRLHDDVDGAVLKGLAQDCFNGLRVRCSRNAQIRRDSACQNSLFRPMSERSGSQGYGFVGDSRLGRVGDQGRNEGILG